MKQFTKKIVRSSKYVIPGKTPREEVITPDRIQKWAATANKMIAHGLKIPAPVNHDFNAQPIVVGPNGLSDAEKNSGFWTKFFTKAEDGHTALYGVLETPDALADKVGATIQETSVYVRPKFQDGKGRVWNDALMHVALVNNPIEPDQENFQPMEKGSLALSMAMERIDDMPLQDSGSAAVETEGQPDPQAAEQFQNQTCNISELLAQLREVAGIDLLEDTLPDNLAERLLAALRQKRLSELEEDELEGSTRQPPKNSKEPSRPIAMSQKPEALTPEQINDLVMAHPAYKEARETAKNLLNHIADNARKAIVGRIQRLVQSGVCTKEYADSKLMPLAAAHQVSFAQDGKTAPSTAEVLLDALEAIPAAAPKQEPGLAMSIPFAAPSIVPGSWPHVQRQLAMSMGQNVNDFQVQPPPGTPVLTDAEMNAAADAMLAAS